MLSLWHILYRFTLQTWKEIILKTILGRIITKIINEPLFSPNFDKIESDAMRIHFWLRSTWRFYFRSWLQFHQVWLRYKEKFVIYIYIYISRIIDFKIMYGIQRRLVSNDCTKVTDPWRKAGLGSGIYTTRCSLVFPLLESPPIYPFFSLLLPFYRVGKSSLRLLCVIRQADLDTR